MREEMSIAHNNYDIIFRSMTEQFKEKALDFYGIHVAPIVRVEPTDLPIIAVNDRRMDFLFLLADDTYLHLEFQTTFREHDLDRFLQYDVSAYEKYKKPIHTVVIYSANVDNAPRSKNYGSIKYETQAVFMKDYDGDQIMKQLKTKIENNEELTERDELNLIFLPLMKSTVDCSKRAIEAVELAQKITDPEKQFRLLSTIIAVSDKFIDEKYVERLMEAIKMVRVLRELEKRAELKGRIFESQQAIKKYMKARYGAAAKEIQDKVDTITDLYILTHLLDDIFGAETREEIERLIDEAITKQSQMNQSTKQLEK